MSFAGIAYLVWVLVIGVSRHLANGLSHFQFEAAASSPLPHLSLFSRAMLSAFIHAAPVFDLAGLLWLLVSLALIVGAGRQRWSISCPWICAICQSMAAALIAIWAALAVQSPWPALHVHPPEKPYPTAGWTGLSVAIAFALVMWVTTLLWLLSERARLMRGPDLRDGLRTHIPG